MFTITPLPRFFISRSVSREPYASPKKFTSIISCTRRMSISSAAACGIQTPALLTHTSILPNFLTASFARRLTCASRVTSATTGVAQSSSATFVSSTFSRALTTTFAPSRAHARASARPSPRLAPVMTTTLFRRSIVKQASLLRRATLFHGSLRARAAPRLSCIPRA